MIFQTKMTHFSLLMTLALIVPSSSQNSSSNNETLCDCPTIEVVTTNETVLELHPNVLGRYNLLPQLLNGRPAYKNDNKTAYIYYLVNEVWAVSHIDLNSTFVNFLNENNAFCPYALKSLWSYFVTDESKFVYDKSLHVVCVDDPCSKLRCGFNAICKKDSNDTATCECKEQHHGDPTER